jgi:predicted RNA-binding Zn-ribbon protein involved in translation (DUF1610 family)
MIVFKACTRCQGDVHVKDDQHGTYFDCIQCGATTEVVSARDVPIDLTSLHEIA